MPGPGDRHPYRWVMFGGVFAVYFAFGVLVMAMPPLLGEIRADLGISRSAMGLALGAWAAIYIVTAPPAGRVIDRIGLRWSIAIGGAFLIASGLARAAAGGLASLWLAIALFGFGGPLISSGAPKLISVWFGDARERRFAVGAYTTAPALGGAATLALTNSVWLPWLGDWRSVIVLDTLIAVAAVAIWLVVATRAPSPPRQEIAKPEPMVAQWRGLLRSRGVQLALILGIGVFFINHAMNGWLPNLLEEDHGFTSRTASAWVAAATLVGVIASLTLPRLATVERRTGLLVGVLGAIAASLAIILVASSRIDPVGILALGLRSVLVPLVVVTLLDAEGVTPANSGAANGLWFSFAEIGGVLGPLVVGAFGDSAVGFDGALVVLIAVCGGLSAVAIRWNSTTARADIVEDASLPTG